MAVGVGCTQPTGSLDDPQTREALKLLMPQEIQIAPFTRVESFDQDARPDGIALLLRPINVLGAPANIVGMVRVELFEFVQASAIATGPRLAVWEVSLNTEEDWRKYWSSTTQMYEFRLEVESDVLPSSRKYVLVATYNTPLGEHLTDQYILELPIASEEFAEPEA